LLHFALTTEADLGIESLVTAIGSKASAPRRVRLLSLLLFLTVFFLPLHFHPLAVTAHITKECSCIHGARTEMGMAPVQVDWTPPIQQVSYEPLELQLPSGLVNTLQLIRAPPAL
jgi:hypothetical protein